MAAPKPIKIVAFSGSIRKGSYNKGLIRAAIEISKEALTGVEIEFIDISDLPMINTDLECDGKFPELVEELRQKVLRADAILFASAEYNFSVSPPLKNAIDWASRPPNMWAGKPAAIISAGGGYGGGLSQFHLRQVGVFIDLHFINKPMFTVNAFTPPAKFDADGNLIDLEIKERLKCVLEALQQFTLRLGNQ